MLVIFMETAADGLQTAAAALQSGVCSLYRSRCV